MLAVLGNTPSDRCLDTDGLEDLEFGSEMKVKEFLLRTDVAFFNHGSYGSAPRRVVKVQEEYIPEREMHPDIWTRLNSKLYVAKTRAALADFVGARVENIQLVVNATQAINLVVRSFPFEKGDTLLYCNHTYKAIINMCEEFTSRTRPDIESVKVELPFPPPSEEDIIKKYTEILDEHPNIKLTIIDHITSPISILMPLKKLVDLCHSRGVKVIVDGAHSIGQLPLYLEELGAEAFTANAHKWLYTPHSCAILYLREDNHAWVRPLATSHKMGSSLDQQFFDQGTRDPVPEICARHGLEFYQAVGGMGRIVGYTRALADEAIETIEREVGLIPAPFPKSMEAPNLRLVEFPPLKTFPYCEENEWQIHKALFVNPSVFGGVYALGGKFYLRISTQVYTSREDVKALIQVLKKFIDNNIKF